MCGIAGFIDFSKQSSLEILTSMTNTMLHRGPDGFGTESYDNQHAQIGFGHRRLAIIELTDLGKQPMEFEHLRITFNGEIYNYREIRSDLIALGHNFKTESDTEVILHAYAEWNTKCVEKFIGMFAIVIYDSLHDQVFIVRDRAGVKPLFYYQNQNLFLFASELKAFHKHPRFEKEINKDAVASFLQHGNIPTPHCIFKNAYKLKPGHYLLLNVRNATAEIFQYWNVYDAYNNPKLDLSFKEAISETEKILQSACDYRMVADVPVGIFLSGGYDSTTVAALLQKDRSDKLKTFTIGVSDIGLNEAPYAKDIAKHIGTEHTEFLCTEKEALELIPELPFLYDEPFADSSAIPTILVSRMARKDVTVALSADAGDEIFAGYNRYDYLLRYGNKLNKIPGFAKKSVAALMNMVPANTIPVLRNKYNFHNRYEKLKSILMDSSSEQIMRSLSEQYTEKQLETMLNFDATTLETSYTSSELKSAFYSPLTYMMSIDYQTYLLDDILQKVDRGTMSASLEGREPFLDHRIIEFAAQLPDHFKYNNGVKKHILKEITHQYIPKTLLDRPKMGFAIPIGKWMQSELKDLVNKYLSEEQIKKQGLFNWSEVSKMKILFLSGKTEYEMKIWYLLMFQMWWEKWM